MQFLNRLKKLPFENLIFFLFLSYLFFALYRFAYPVPKNWYFPGFLLQFAISFSAQMYSRKSGRIITAAAAILISRLTWIAEPELPFHLTDTIGLFLGAILGIWLREVLLVLSGRSEVALPKQSDLLVTGWFLRNPLSLGQGSVFLQTPFYFLYLLLVLVLCSYFAGFGFSFLEGLGSPEFFYYPKISSREYLSLPILILASVGFPLLYFFAEERFATNTSKEAIAKHLSFGILIGFLIQLTIILIQEFYSAGFLSAGSNLSVSAGRMPGLFVDSGSSSWLVPVIASYFILSYYQKYKLTKENFCRIIIAFLIIIVSIIGIKQAKAFWVIWFGFLFVSAIIAITSAFIRSNIKLWIVRSVLFLSLPLFGIGILFGFSKLKSPEPLVSLGTRYISFQSELFRSKDLGALRELDETRYDLLKISLENFKRKTWFGNGLASLPMELKNPNREGTKLKSNLIDLPPNFFISILTDLGIFGTMIFLGLVGLFVWERNNYINISLLFLPFLFGMQVQHCDGAFIALFLLFYPLGSIAVANQMKRNSTWFRYTVLILSIGLPLHYLILFSGDFIKSGTGADFRKNELGFYQTQATRFASGNEREDEFHGKIWEWKLSKESARRSGTFSFRTKDENLQIELIWLNLEKRLLLKTLANPAPNGYYIWRGTFPPGAEFVRLKSKTKTELFVSKDYFDYKNQFGSL
ncbi:O-antigen ligase family protein [Leptospira sp. 'Mane']|uniref:O-antigen ligase family protein n=1 Tax=Leptospira sp. 'Mane' TaxID=3387407 RepID=UPI00398B69E5